MVHGELGYGPVEISTADAECCSGVMALRSACLQVAIGEKQNAISAASEFASCWLKSSRYKEISPQLLPTRRQCLWKLRSRVIRFSDGAGAVVVQGPRASSGFSLRIDGISLPS